MKMNKEVLSKIDAVVSRFEDDRDIYDNNVHKCYRVCKRIVYKAEDEGKIEWDDRYVDYITEKLGI